MPCYGVETEPIERLAARLRVFPPDLMDMSPDALPGYADRQVRALMEIEQAFLEAFTVYLSVVLAIASRRLLLERRDERHESRSGMPPRQYLEPFLSLYASSAEISMERLRALLAEVFNDQPELRAVFVGDILASRVGDEMTIVVANMPTGENVEEVDDHGRSAKEVMDSVKGLIQTFLLKVSFGPVRLKKDHVKQGLHVLNEITNMIFKGHG